MQLRNLPPVYTSVRVSDVSRALLQAVAGESAVERNLETVREFFRSSDILLTESGTVALAMALELGDRPRSGAVVALPGWACPDIGAAAAAARANITLYDLDPESLQPDLRSLEQCLQNGATHVVAVHFFGRLTDVVPIKQLSIRYGATLIEDAAQGAGAELRGVRAGELSEIGVLSFGRGKGRNAGGGGALLVSKAAALALPELPVQYQATPQLRQAAVMLFSELFSRPWLFGLPRALPLFHIGETRYEPVEHRRGPTALALGVLPKVLASQEAEAAARRRIANLWRQQLAAAPLRLLNEPIEGSTDGAIRFPLRLEAEQARGLQRYGLVRSYPRRLDEYDQIARLVVDPRPLPGATALSSELHTLPTHAFVTTKDIQIVSALLGSGVVRTRR